MIPNDRAMFAKAMYDCYDVYGKEANEKTIDLYFKLLMDYDLQAVLNGLESVLRSSKFFPKPSEVVEAVEGKENENIDIAYQDAKSVIYNGFHDAIRLTNPITMQVIEDMGGQEGFYNKVFILGENDTAAYFEFTRIYKRYYRMYKSGQFKPSVKYLKGYMNLLPDARPVSLETIKLLGNDHTVKIDEPNILKIGGNQ